MDDEPERQVLDRERADLVRQAENLGQCPDALTAHTTNTLMAMQGRLREIDRRLIEVCGGEAPRDDI